MPDLNGRSRSRAILIGTSAYRDPAYPPLPAAANSLNGFHTLMLNPALCAWPADRVTVLRDTADARRVLQQLRRLAEQTEDVLLVYFVGHGTLLPSGQLCLTLADTDASDPDLTGIEYSRIRDILLRSPARVKVTILDCCHSGRVIALEALSAAADIADATDTEGVYTLTASDHFAHVPPPDRQADECTSFTGELIKLIQDGIPGQPGELTLHAIYRALKLRLIRAGLPSPNQRGTDTADQFKFSRNAAQTRDSSILHHRYAVDIVVCVDTSTGSGAALPKAKESMLAIWRRIAAAMGRLGYNVIRQRMRIIGYGRGGVVCTPFFSFPEDAYECETAIENLEMQDGSNSLDGLAAVREAIDSDWEPLATVRNKQFIVVLAGTTEANAAVPEKLLDSLFNAWYESARANKFGIYRELILFAPHQPPWDFIANNFDMCLHYPTPNGFQMSKMEDEVVLDAMACEI